MQDCLFRRVLVIRRVSCFSLIWLMIMIVMFIWMLIACVSPCIRIIVVVIWVISWVWIILLIRIMVTVTLAVVFVSSVIEKKTFVKKIFVFGFTFTLSILNFDFPSYSFLSFVSPSISSRFFFLSQFLRIFSLQFPEFWDAIFIVVGAVWTIGLDLFFETTAARELPVTE